ncbi:hypothetical protein BDFG_01937 [Blastomyces dermatitidis ATCC 26199]|nr:hypothetical protein BDFG_01937 [Blastomyces dermatitidis ATCC 26199]
MLGLLFIFCAALLLSAAFALSSTSHRCRCRPNQAYWPSVKEWDAFNASASENFVPHGSPKDQDGQGPTVTIEAGLQLAELYKGLGAKGHMVVGGYSHGVGAAGGYVQGGGHSILGPWKRMASDNALQFRVITTCGGVVIANEYKNQDLFWALRGVGGLVWA